MENKDTLLSIGLTISTIIRMANFFNLRFIYIPCFLLSSTIYFLIFRKSKNLYARRMNTLLWVMDIVIFCKFIFIEI